MLQTLVEDLHALDSSDPRVGLIVDVRSRRELADHLEESFDLSFETWEACCEAIADPDESPQYEDFELEPMIGLVPIGRDPISKLWEFVDV